VKAKTPAIERENARGLIERFADWNIGSSDRSMRIAGCQKRGQGDLERNSSRMQASAAAVGIVQ
jgi:hypothetical protein